MAVTALALDASSDPRPAQPVVSIAVPMLNEARYILACLDSFAAQDYPLDHLDMMVIDGGSDDGSRIVVEAYAKEHPWVRVVDNPVGTAAAAFNVGMYEAHGQVVCLFSSHGVADPTFVSASVDALHRSGAAGVGGEYRHEGTDPRSASIGAAMVSPVGMASPHRFASEARDVDTISHPVYWRDAMLATGPFDEALKRNSDYEFNYRVRAGGERLHFDPAIGSVYRPRPTLNALFRQFWFYGKWKARVAERYPATLRPRHLVAPAAVVGAVAAPFALLVRPLRVPVAVVAGLYASLVALGTAKASRGRDDLHVPTLAAAFPVMHSAWGAGFLASTLRRLFGGPRLSSEQVSVSGPTSDSERNPT
ncbi:MAG: glycosyltransferase family 2 protein [Acidimicrobiales bacterium]|nr:glycosyltransferase family 2 protein [Acidimicrobiales bacterium]